jgi:hypothetical protein
MAMSMVEVEFRDGFRLVPSHVADLLHNYKTWTMTYEEAIKKSNTAMAADFANDAMRKIVSRHTETHR